MNSKTTTLNIGAPVNLFGNAEDQIIQIKVLDANNAIIGVRDMMTGESLEKECTTEQAGAMAMLMIAGDAVVNSEPLYDMIGTLFDGVPVNLRPIP
jgi:hypothetical protein